MSGTRNTSQIKLFRIFPEDFHFEVTLDEDCKVHTNWFGLNEYQQTNLKEVAWAEKAYQELRQLLFKRYGELHWIPITSYDAHGHIQVKIKSRKPLPLPALESRENHHFRLQDHSKLRPPSPSDGVIDI